MEYNFSDLYEAIEIGDLELINEIISGKPDVIYGQDEYGFTAIHAVASIDDEEIANIILNKGLDINAKNDEGITALHIVLYQEITQLLIDQGANVNCVDNFGNTPLHIQASDGEDAFDVIQVLLNNGADKEKINNSGERAYDISKSRADINNMRILK